MTVEIVKITQNLLASNDEVANLNRRAFLGAGVLTINVIASPGAGKTSLIIKTMEALRSRASVGVIEGDIAGSIDTEKVLAAGACQAVQVNTGGNCHLEAHMVQQALSRFDLQDLDILFIENVGNLVCPTNWALGEQLKLCILSTAEGHDKPIKYPQIFAAADAIVLNKIDLSALVDFDSDFFYNSARALNRHAPIFETSCRTGAGLAAWADWLISRSRDLINDQAPAPNTQQEVTPK